MREIGEPLYNKSTHIEDDKELLLSYFHILADGLVKIIEH